MLVYNLLTPEPEAELLPLARRNGVGVIARTPLASGFLTGAVTAATEFGAGDYRSLWPRERREHEAARAAAFDFLATDARTPSQAALRFCLAHPAVSAVVPGMMSVEQAADGVAALAAPPLVGGGAGAGACHLVYLGVSAGATLHEMRHDAEARAVRGGEAALLMGGAAERVGGEEQVAVEVGIVQPG